MLFQFLLSSLYAQNLIVNPEFREVSISYTNGKHVYPKDWKSFSWPFPPFYHPENEDSGDFFAKKSLSLKNGILGLEVLQESNGIFSRLTNTMITGQMYNVSVRLRVGKLGVNSERSIRITDHQSGRRIDSASQDYNVILSLMFTFYHSIPDCNNIEQGSFYFLDFPANAKQISEDWIVLSSRIVATGDENYFSIGSCNNIQYIKQLRKIKADSSDYSHKWAFYYIDSVNVSRADTEVNQQQLIITSFGEAGNKINYGKRFIVRNINFGIDSSNLTESSCTELLKVLIYLRKDSLCGLKICGYTDTTGSKSHNQILSEKRAQTVYAFFVSHGISKNRLKWQGKGEENPLNQALLKENLGVNRRVEFELFQMPMH
jgi:outer membrane protein OmpA-like peptidoglycan-associated protein